MDAPTREGRCIFYVCYGSTMIHTLHRAQERHTDSLRGCYRHRTPSGARQRASAGKKCNIQVY